MKQTLIILILPLIVLIKKGSTQSNPCPHVFQFKSNEHGIITIPPFDKGLNRLIVKIGIRDPYEGNNSLSLVKSIGNTLADSKRGEDVQYRLDFMRGKGLPNIVNIRLNTRDICIGPKQNNTQEFELQTKHYFKPSYNNDPTISINEALEKNSQQKSSSLQSFSSYRSRRSTQPNDASWLGSLPSAGTCGRTLQPTHLIINGVGVNEGEYPWMVAMFHYEGSSTVYRCGASLISKKYVVTAAHCTKNQTRVRLEFGRYNIKESSEGHSFHRISTNIIAHPEYNGEAHGDVALVSFEPISFTEWVKPICLWANFDTKLRRGAVAGWGQLDNDGSLSNTPKQLIVSMVELEICKNSQEKLRNIATGNTFCAGGQNAGPCHGDSGGGFYVVRDNIWYLRGIISRSLGTSWTCNVNEYAVYADLAYSLEWIRPYLSDPVPETTTKKISYSDYAANPSKYDYKIGPDGVIKISLASSSPTSVVNPSPSPVSVTTEKKKLSLWDYADNLSKYDYKIDENGVIRFVSASPLSAAATTSPLSVVATTPKKQISFSDYQSNPSKYDFKIDSNGVATFVLRQERS